MKHFFIKKVRIRCSNFLANLFDFSSGDVRKAAIATADFVIVAISAIIAAFITQLFLEDTLSERLVAVLAVGSALGCVAAFSILKVYHIQWMDFCQRHFVSCFGGVLMGDMAAVLILGLWLAYRQIPLKPFVVCSGIHIVVSCMSVFLFRYLFRKTFHLLIQLNANMYNGKRTLIIGGGYACMVLLQEQQRQKRMHFSSNVWMECFDPICILDDDISKHGKSVAGVQIVGKTNEVRKYVHKYSIEQILFAIPSCPKKRRQKILNACNNLQIPVKLVPAFDVHSMSVLGQVRDINMEDLLGRDPVQLDTKRMEGFIQNRVCMVTGGGGSIGSELVRQIASYHPQQLIVVDIYENNAYNIQQEIKMQYEDAINLVVEIASVRDYHRMQTIFTKYHPQIVFHAAAHKHVPLMEECPMEAVKNNIMGTFHTASLASAYRVEKFVMISTDKAVNPTNIMGASKRFCEMIVQCFSMERAGETKYVATRFGNVLGSSGSVVPLFRQQIAAGKPVTVTHPDVTRYFMTIPEAVSLVLEAATFAKGGEVFVMDMGEPVKILTLAENLIRMCGKKPYADVEIEFTGLRKGEKMYEETLSEQEKQMMEKTENDRIFISNQEELGVESVQEFWEMLRTVRDAANNNDDAEVRRLLHLYVPTFEEADTFNQRKQNNKQA